MEWPLLTAPHQPQALVRGASALLGCGAGQVGAGPLRGSGQRSESKACSLCFGSPRNAPWRYVLRAWLDCNSNTRWEAAASCTTGETGRYRGNARRRVPKEASGRGPGQLCHPAPTSPPRASSPWQGQAVGARVVSRTFPGPFTADPPALRRMAVVAAVPSALLTLHVYTPRSSAVTTRMVRSWKFLSVEEMRRRLLLSRRAPSAAGESEPQGKLPTGPWLVVTPRAHTFFEPQFRSPQ